MRLRNVFLPLVIRIGLLRDGSRLRGPLNSILSPGYAPFWGLAFACPSPTGTGKDPKLSWLQSFPDAALSSAKGFRKQPGNGNKVGSPCQRRQSPNSITKAGYRSVVLSRQLLLWITLGLGDVRQPRTSRAQGLANKLLV